MYNEGLHCFFDALFEEAFVDGLALRAFMRQFIFCYASPMSLHNFQWKSFKDRGCFFQQGEVLVESFDLDGVNDLGVVVVGVHLNVLTDLKL